MMLLSPLRSAKAFSRMSLFDLRISSLFVARRCSSHYGSSPAALLLRVQSSSRRAFYGPDKSESDVTRRIADSSRKTGEAACSLVILS
jgi:hypothetical protein